jgi:hypothetical protein
MINDIKIGIGFGQLKFGATMTEVKTYLGEAEAVISSGETPNNVIAWHYWDRSYSIYFDESENYLFSSITLQDQDAVLFGQKIFCLDIDKLKDLFFDNGYKEFSEEKWDDGSTDLSIFDAACIAFFSKDGTLKSFDWFTLTDDETDTTIWP